MSDDGRCFRPAVVTADHMGLGIVRQPAEAIGARLAVASAPAVAAEGTGGQGTSVSLTWRRPARGDKGGDLLAST